MAKFGLLIFLDLATLLSTHFQTTSIFFSLRMSTSPETKMNKTEDAISTAGSSSSSSADSSEISKSELGSTGDFFRLWTVWYESQRKRECLFIFLLQLLSTFGSWRPTKENTTQFSVACISIIVLKHMFWRPKSRCLRPSCWETQF